MLISVSYFSKSLFDMKANCCSCSKETLLFLSVLVFSRCIETLADAQQDVRSCYNPKKCSQSQEKADLLNEVRTDFLEQAKTSAISQKPEDVGVKTVSNGVIKTVRLALKPDRDNFLTANRIAGNSNNLSGCWTSSSTRSQSSSLFSSFSLTTPSVLNYLT